MMDIEINSAPQRFVLCDLDGRQWRAWCMGLCTFGFLFHFEDNGEQLILDEDELEIMFDCGDAWEVEP